MGHVLRMLPGTHPPHSGLKEQAYLVPLSFEQMMQRNTVADLH